MPNRSDGLIPSDFSTGMAHASVQAVGTPTDEEMELINLQARKPLAPEQVYVFRMEISNDLTDSYFTQMDPKTSLPNYASDFKEGRSLLPAHDSDALPIGRSFNGELAQRGERGNEADPLRTAVITSSYLQRGLVLDAKRASNDDVISGIDGGTIRDGSIRFGGGSYICSECGRDMYEDMFNWDDPDACMHWPGMSYGEGADKHVATALIKDARASEHSLVFDGATPMAMIERATIAASRGKIAEKVVRRLERLYDCRIVRPKIELRSEVLELHAEPVVELEPLGQPAAQAGEAPARQVETDPDRFLELVDRHVREAAEYLGVEYLGRLHDAAGIEPRWADMTALERAEWTTSYVNDLPDSAFAYVGPGGTKDDGGKTTPRDLRYFPHHDDSGSPDEAHVRNALARIPQASIPDSAKASAEAHVKAHAKALGIEVEENSAPPARRRHQPIEGVIDLDPKVFADLMGSPLDVEARQRYAAALLDRVDDLDFSFCREVAAAFSSSRAGRAISAENASKIQNALDHMATAQESHDNAVEVLNNLLNIGVDATPEYGDPDPAEGIQDLDPGQASSSAAAGALTPSSSAETGIPDTGVIGRAAGGRSEVAGQGVGQPALTDKVLSGLAGIKAILDDLLGEDDDFDADHLEGSMGGQGTDLDGDEGRARAERAERSSIVRAILKREFRKAENAGVRKFFTEAEAGRRFREELSRELHEWGVRARGVDYNRELHERLSPSYSIEDLVTMVRELETEAYKRFRNEHPGELPEWAHSLAESVGRQTVATPVADVYGQHRRVTTNGTSTLRADAFKHKAGRASDPVQK